MPFKKRILSKKKNGEFYYPEKIPRLRENYFQPGFSQNVNSFLLGLVLFFVLGFIQGCFCHQLFVTCTGIMAYIIFELFQRVNLLSVEYYHLKSRYDGNLIKLLKEVFDFSGPSIFTFFVLILYLSLNFIKDNQFPILNNFSVYIWPTTLLSVLLLGECLELKKATIYDRLFLEQNHGLNYGAGMAYSYFHGYLKKILPKTEGKDKHLCELMDNFADVQGINFPIKKLFILIPRSIRCPINIADDSPDIEQIMSLEEKQLQVAGVKDRSYKNTVYKIFDRKNNKNIYICAEYASPLNTFYQVCQDKKGRHVDYCNFFEADILLQFYETLKDILEAHDDIQKLCELIFFDDKEEDGSSVDVAQILLEKIRQIQTNNKKYL